MLIGDQGSRWNVKYQDCDEDSGELRATNLTFHLYVIK